jgi:hypothetical protein
MSDQTKVCPECGAPVATWITLYRGGKACNQCGTITEMPPIESLEVVRSVSGTWHIWHSDIDGLARTECNRLVKVWKRAQIARPAGLLPVLFARKKMCSECDWYRRKV